MRRHLWIAIVLVLALAIAACGGKKEAEPTPAPAAETTAESAPVASAGDPANGRTLFIPSCSACHGPEGKGVENLGKDMTSSQFIAEQTDAELLEFLKVGRAPDHPLNTTGVLMPPRGGNPALSDEDLLDIIAYMHTLQQ